MFAEMRTSIAEEFGEVETVEELKALWSFGQVTNNEYADAECVPMFKAAVARLRAQPPVLQGVPQEVPAMETENDARIRELSLEIQRLRTQVKPPVAQQRSGRKYRLLDTNVSWSTKPQVQALMQIIAAHVPVGGVADEEDIVAACEANEAVLATRQGGKKIWNYYKGTHAEGLMAHGNIEKVN
jgi:hypothetical protein